MSAAPHLVERTSALVLAMALSLCVMTACGGPKADPVEAALTAYEPVIEPVLHEQEDISKLFVAITLDKIEPDGAIVKIKGEAIPKGQSLLEKVQAIKVSEPTVQGLHQQLIEASTLRVDGYRLMVKGFEDKDLNSFNEGKQKVTDSKIREESYVSQLDSLARHYGIKIDFFPPTGP